MKLLRRGKGGYLFAFAERERTLLLGMVQMYPLVPAARQRLSRQPQGEQAEENQQLLDEALAAQRQENRRQILAFVQDESRFRLSKHGFELTLQPAELEWLLQVLNDVRVGSWIALGEPAAGAEPEFTEANAKYLIALELCGIFQSQLLRALGVDESTDWAEA